MEGHIGPDIIKSRGLRLVSEPLMMVFLGSNIYVYYIHPELRMGDCYFDLGKRVKSLYGEYEES